MHATIARSRPIYARCLVQGRAKAVGKTGLGHPAGARKATIVDDISAYRATAGVKAEYDFHRFPPVSALLCRVKQAEMVGEVAFIIGRKMWLVRRTVLEWSNGHREPRRSLSL